DVRAVPPQGEPRAPEREAVRLVHETDRLVHPTAAYPPPDRRLQRGFISMRPTPRRDQRRGVAERERGLDLQRLQPTRFAAGFRQQLASPPGIAAVQNAFDETF